eukprot:426865_1
MSLESAQCDGREYCRRPIVGDTYLADKELAFPCKYDAYTAMLKCSTGGELSWKIVRPCTDLRHSRNQTGAADRHHRHSRRPEAQHSFHSSRDLWWPSYRSLHRRNHRRRTCVYDGGHPIDRYTLETTDGKHVSIPTGSSFEITGLTNGQLLECHLKAHNAMGESTVAVISGTPGTKPGQPTDIIVTPGDQKLTIHFTRLATDGGHPIDRYTLETTDGKHVSTPITGSAFELIGLTNGQLYEYHLKAHNAMGESTAAVISGTPGTKPGQPTDIIVTPGDQKLNIHFTRLATYGGHRIDRYTVETTDGEHVSTPTGSSFEITGLTNGQLLECHLKAHNAMGESTVAVISGTPGTKPGQPTDIIVTPGDQKLNIHFTRLATDGGHPIDRYTLETTDGKHVSIPTGSSFEMASCINITGLTNGHLYEYHLKAHNAMGESTAAVISGTPDANQQFATSSTQRPKQSIFYISRDNRPPKVNRAVNSVSNKLAQSRYRYKTADYNQEGTINPHSATVNHGTSLVHPEYHPETYLSPQHNIPPNMNQPLTPQQHRSSPQRRYGGTSHGMSRSDQRKYTSKRRTHPTTIPPSSRQFQAYLSRISRRDYNTNIHRMNPPSNSMNSGLSQSRNYNSARYGQHPNPADPSNVNDSFDNKLNAVYTHDESHPLSSNTNSGVTANMNAFRSPTPQQYHSNTAQNRRCTNTTRKPDQNTRPLNFIRFMNMPKINTSSPNNVQPQVQPQRPPYVSTHVPPNVPPCVSSHVQPNMQPPVSHYMQPNTYSQNNVPPQVQPNLQHPVSPHVPSNVPPPMSSHVPSNMQPNTPKRPKTAEPTDFARFMPPIEANYGKQPAKRSKFHESMDVYGTDQDSTNTLTDSFSVLGNDNPQIFADNMYNTPTISDITESPSHYTSNTRSVINPDYSNESVLNSPQLSFLPQPFTQEFPGTTTSYPNTFNSNILDIPTNNQLMNPSEPEYNNGNTMLFLDE